jgi:hypothetical protein
VLALEDALASLAKHDPAKPGSSSCDFSVYNLAHGTLAAEALTPTTTRLTYTMPRDNSILPDDAARIGDEEARRARVSEWLKNMKVLAQGGKLPPKPAGSLRPPITTPFLNPNPHYASLPMSIVVDAPVEKVWARVGKYCDIGEWGFRSCNLISGKEGEIGPFAPSAIRSSRGRLGTVSHTRSRCALPVLIRCIQTMPRGRSRSKLTALSLRRCSVT